MGTFPGSMCHSARLAQRNLPAGEKKTTKGLSNKKVLRMRVRTKKQNNDKYSEKQSHEKTRKTKPLILAITHDKILSERRLRERRLRWWKAVPSRATNWER